MKTAREWIADWLEPAWDGDDDLEDMIASLEVRDREVRAATLREAADVVWRGEGNVYAGLLDMADRAERGE
jgi:hypothetical protein